MDDGQFLRAGRLSDLEEGVPAGVVLENGERVCVVRQGTQVWAVQDVCPHRAFALSGGDCVSGPDGEPLVECPWHGARFSLRTGEVTRGPATDPLPVFAVRVTDGDVFVGARLAHTSREER